MLLGANARRAEERPERGAKRLEAGVAQAHGRAAESGVAEGATSTDTTWPSLGKAESPELGLAAAHSSNETRTVRDHRSAARMP